MSNEAQLKVKDREIQVGRCTFYKNMSIRIVLGR